MRALTETFPFFNHRDLISHPQPHPNGEPMTALKSIAAAITVAGLLGAAAHAANLKSVSLISASARFNNGQGGASTSFSGEYEARDQGVDHICEVRYSVDGWRTWGTARARFDRLVAGAERWKVDFNVPGNVGSILHVFTCRDLGATTQVFSPSNGTNITSFGLEVSTRVNTTLGTFN
jgi:hypothetical protein